MTTIIKNAEDLKQAVAQAEARFAHQPTPQYPEDYTQRELYQQFKGAMREMAIIRSQHLLTHGGIMPDFGCDTAVSTYLEVLAALDYAEDIMSFNCDDYAYDNVDRPFAKIRRVLEARITAGVEDARKTWAKREELNQNQ